ncbi:hypothetical protein BJY16_006646 [Actinoplanes octamycinicus]|uniref:von Hippel-Lindau disease tumour suppressor beta domain-containing protein n=1 Tax=Actinoplanes octamycinicus TaxID=135948 RepID=A0A7W7H3G7_9ACTN|nr:hypothetical protein [Actinoplanes octamycinicus]MBB4743187.1 hypothetical protein [Actinoplanes octamycinicus]GIE61250.1 hypothetical protein Aoc01nite_66520 [Actinoplanes octamycinicus]
MTEKLPDVPPAYRLPPVVAYQPPPPPARKRTGLIILASVLGALLAAGGAFVVFRAAPRDSAPPTVAAPAEPAATGLEALPADAESRLTSATDGASTSIHFTNETADPVTIMWLGYDRKRVFYTELPPGQGYDQQTYTGHVWVVTRADGTAIAVFQATAEPARATIR